MTHVSRRTFHALVGACVCGLVRPRIAEAVVGDALPKLPIGFAVATDAGQPVQDAAWIQEHLDAMESLYGPLGIHPEQAFVRPLEARFAHMESRADRDALMAERRPGVVNVFVVGSLRDVDDPSVMRRGVHWRNRATPSARYVILSAIAKPFVLAHEMGHYFGLGHSATPDNLMSYERAGGTVFLDTLQARVIEAAARQVFLSGEVRPRGTSRE